MKKQKQTKTSQQAAQGGAGNAANPEAASPGLIAYRDTGAGSGEGAMARARPVTPIDSSLLGESPEPRPAAEPRERPEAADEAVRKSVPVTGAGVTESKAPASAADAALPPAAPAPAPTAAPVQRAQIRKTGFWPVVLGGVVAAGIGAGATIWALPHLPPEWLPAAQPAPEQPGFDAEGIRAEAVAAAQDSAQQLVDDFAASFEPPAPAEGDQQAAFADIDGLRQELADLRARVDDQAGRLDEVQAAATAAAAAVATAPAAAPAAVDPQTEQQLAELSQQVEELAQLEQRINAAAEQASQQIADARAEAEQMQAQAAEGTRRAEAVAAIASLQAALDRGISADQAREALNEAGIDAPEGLAQDVPSLDSLQADFPDAARAALRASLRDDSASGSGNVLTNFLRAQTGARSVAPREGSDPDAILSRADAAVEAGRIGDALTEMQGLPETARSAPAMADWLRRATIWHDAQAALSDLSATTN